MGALRDVHEIVFDFAVNPLGSNPTSRSQTALRFVEARYRQSFAIESSDSCRSAAKTDAANPLRSQPPTPPQSAKT